MPGRASEESIGNATGEQPLPNQLRGIGDPELSIWTGRSLETRKMPECCQTERRPSPARLDHPHR